MNRHLALGIDFGSLSGRALLVDLATGAEEGLVVCPYKHGFIEDTLPSGGVKLPPDWTLQDPADYLDVLASIPRLLAQSRADAAEVVGVGIDFTASTVLPVQADGTPLCFLPAFKSHPHAYVKAWKHHAAQPYANRISELARTPVVVVCAGAKAILDLDATLEWLETAGVPVLGYGTNEFPAFYTRSSGLPVDVRVDTPNEAAAIVRTHWELGLGSGLLLTVPVPAEAGCMKTLAAP